MGKCVSKDQHLQQIREIDERSYIAISDEFEYYQYEGQSESKKSSKKMSGPETKGTSISFGFKKKIYSSSSAANKKLNAANNNNGNGEDQQTATIISNHNVIKADQKQLTGDDDNGNSNNPDDYNNSDKETATTGRSTTPRLQPPKRDQAQPPNARSNRFGFRQNIVRPAGGITPKFNEFDKLNNNNTAMNDKRRSRSCTTGPPRSHVTFAQQSVKTVDEEQSHTNANTRPQAVVLSRYTLHSTSLPRPQYPVPVSVTSTAASAPPTYKRSTTFTSFSSNGSGNSNQVQSKLMDTKGAKHAANLYKRGGMIGRRDESLDSGIASHDSASEQHQLYMDSMLSRRPRQRSRHFEMVPTGRHKFEIRDLNDFSDNSVVVPLLLPKLPTNRREIVTGGLIRSTNSYNTDNETDMSISYESSNTRPASIVSTSEAESYDEEKVKIDNSFSEKTLKSAMIKEEALSKNSSPASSKASWFGNANESMATKNCSSISLSSSDEERKVVQKNCNKKDIDCDEDDLSSMTITADHSSYLNSSTMRTSPTKDQKQTVNDAFMRQPKMGTISRKDLFIQMDEIKFAETVDKVKDSALLDDETSPTDSLVSSSDSGDVLMKKIDAIIDEGARKTKNFDDIKEQDLEDITPELVDLVSPMTPGTPTHASNSLSLSDGNRDDFLIDDEIADQPALVFNKKHKGSTSHLEDFKTASINLTSDTPTLKDITLNSNGSIRSMNKIHASKTQQSPAMNRKTLERSGSLDTLSPCDSIASDDLMADFELNSSLDSIERPVFSADDLQINSDVDIHNSAGTIKDFDSFLKAQKAERRRNSSRESMTSQLPARATRLLNRRLQTNSNSPLSQNGSDSPRSLDSMHSRNTPTKTSLREHLKQRQQLNLQSNLLNSSSEDLVVDKSLRNSMLQDVVCFKKQLVHLRRILQEDEDNLMRSDTLNPFDVNGQVFNALNGNVCDSEKESSSDTRKEKKDDENNVVLTNEQMALLEDQRQELADLRRQVVFLQSQMDDKDRTIRIQQNMLEQYEKDKTKNIESNLMSPDAKNIETSTCATQTERLRPVSMGQENFTSSSEHLKPDPPLSSRPTPTITVKPSLPKSKTQISSIYTKLSSIKPTSKTNSSTNANSRNSSIPNYVNTKSVKTTQIGSSQASPTKLLTVNNNIRPPVKSPKRIPQLVKPSASNKMSSKFGSKTMMSFMSKDDSNGNSATSSLSTSSSNSSLNANSTTVSPARHYV